MLTSRSMRRCCRALRGDCDFEPKFPKTSELQLPKIIVRNEDVGAPAQQLYSSASATMVLPGICVSVTWASLAWFGGLCHLTHDPAFRQDTLAAEAEKVAKEL